MLSASSANAAHPPLYSPVSLSPPFTCAVRTSIHLCHSTCQPPCHSALQPPMLLGLPTTCSAWPTNQPCCSALQPHVSLRPPTTFHFTYATYPSIHFFKHATFFAYCFLLLLLLSNCHVCLKFAQSSFLTTDMHKDGHQGKIKVQFKMGSSVLTNMAIRIK